MRVLQISTMGALAALATLRHHAEGDVNSPALADPGMEWPEGGELPAQMGGARETLMPGIDGFRLPTAMTQLWHDIVAEDTRALLSNGQPNPNFGKKFQRRQLKFDQNTPLIVVGGKFDGQPLTATFSTNPRPRGKKDDPKTAWVSDVHYLLLIALQDKTYPKLPKEVEETLNRYAGGIIRLEHGLTAQCRPDKVRYIAVPVDGGTQLLQDPSGKKGCGARFYTKDFKLDAGGYATQAQCDCGEPTPEAKAQGAQPVTVMLRAFESVDRILPPA